MPKITTPVKGFVGEVAGVTFANGEAETTDETAIGYFERHGYTVTQTDAEKRAEAKAAKEAVDAAKAEAEAEADAAESAPIAAEADKAKADATK
ncbi:hypothetical protein [Mycetocola spongiae]|uniref:hypothetical protein n=1 Tax=Mycetocola spongiae TaxID=2859226 RepID=UPI001CF52F2C|nr:hypothetical protein [Mycetocola spongiae]UCR89252.1 hypothetical protein KXZ72_00620 [Mycetocola spongiae]